MRRLDCPVQVLREHGCGETVHCIVGLSNHVVLVLEFDDNTDRAKYFLLDDLHVRRGVRENSRFDEEAFRALTFATNLDLGTSILARFNVTHDTLNNPNV